MDQAAAILALVAAYSGKRPDQIDPANLFGKDRLQGDDADEFWDEFAKAFAVDLSALRPYLHYDGNEPPTWRTAWGTDAQGRRIPDIPIGLPDLTAAAGARHWVMTYPDHRLSRRPLILSPPGLLLLLAALFLLALAVL